MKKISVIIFIFFISCLSGYAYDKIATFELNAISEVQNGKIKKSFGKVKQVYALQNGEIYLLKSTNDKDDYVWTGTDKYKTDFNTTFDKQDYYIGYYDSGHWNKSVIQIDKDFKTITLYNWGGLSNHCTIWYGKAIKK